MKQSNFLAAREVSTEDKLGDSAESEALRKILAQEEEKFKTTEQHRQARGKLRESSEPGDLASLAGSAAKTVLVVSLVAGLAAFSFWHLKKKTSFF